MYVNGNAIVTRPIDACEYEIKFQFIETKKKYNRSLK